MRPALAAVEDAAMAIDPDPDLVETLQERFLKNGEVGVYAYASGWMSAMIVRTAKEHAEHCADCQTCHDLSELLSAVAAVQIINPPPMDFLDPVRKASRPAADSRDVAPDLFALNGLVKLRTTLSLIMFITLVVAVVVVLVGGP